MPGPFRYAADGWRAYWSWMGPVDGLVVAVLALVTMATGPAAITAIWG